MRRIRLAVGLALLSLSAFGRAQETPEPVGQAAAEPAGKSLKFRLELKFMYEYLEPVDLYKPWRSFYVMFYGMPKATWNYFLHFGTIYRDGTNDTIGVAGVAHDWTSRFYTYTVFVAGTPCNYLPRFRFDQDFNFKIGKKREFVWAVGLTTIRYHHEHRDFIISSGLTWYPPKWIMEYRLFRNRSDPGNVVSLTHLASVGHGEEGKSWTFFTFSKGSQAYLALNVLTPEEVRQSAVHVGLTHRRWVSRRFGAFLEFDYVHLKDGFDKYGIFLGGFFQF